MGVLENIMQMKEQGKADEEIINDLQQQGVSPNEINNALSQAQIKNAVSNAEETQYPEEQNPPAPQGNYTPQTQEVPEQEMYAPTPQESSQTQEFYPQENYGGYSEQTGVSSDTMIEVAEQVFSEKTKKIQKQLEEINEFKTLAQTKIDNTSDRLKRIETIIDKLQIAILDKIGSYGKNLETIKKEMSMMQDSFGKVINKAVKPHHTTHKTKKTSKKK